MKQPKEETLLTPDITMYIIVGLTFAGIASSVFNYWASAKETKESTKEMKDFISARMEAAKERWSTMAAELAKEAVKKALEEAKERWSTQAAELAKEAAKEEVKKALEAAKKGWLATVAQLTKEAVKEAVNEVSYER